jgi:peroxiredoxin
MKTLTLFFALLMISVSTLAQETATKETSKNKIAIVNIQDMQGNPFNTKDITNDGKPIILCFWATWCKPCIKELGAISDLYDDWTEETGVVLYAVSIDNSRSSKLVEPTVNGKGWEFEVLLDPNWDFKRAMNVGNPPHTFILNGDGEIVWEHTAYVDGNEYEYIDIVEKLNKGEEITH